MKSASLGPDLPHTASRNTKPLKTGNPGDDSLTAALHGMERMGVDAVSRHRAG